jgi:hypothetical protein
MDLKLQNGAVNALENGTMLMGRWRILGVADTDDSYILYDAMDAEDGSVVAVREYCPVSLCERSGNDLISAAGGKQASSFQNGLEQFERIANALQNIPHINPVTACFRENHTCYAVTERAEGKRLFEAAPLLTETYAQSLGVMLADTFSALHRNGVFYGTICEEDLRFMDGGRLHVGTGHLSLEGSVANDLRGLTAFLLSMLPIERDEKPKVAALDKLLRSQYRDAEALKSALLGKPVAKRTVRPGAVKGIIRLVLCAACLTGAVIGIRAIFTKQPPLMRAIRKGKIEPEVISVWMPLREHADEQATIAMYERLAAGFERKYPGCGVDLKIYADGSFEDALHLVENGATPPAVFMDTQDPVVMSQAADLTELTSVLQDVYLADMSGFGNSLPLGCSVPALYCNTYTGEGTADIDGDVIDFSALPADTLYDVSASDFLKTESVSQEPSEYFTEFLAHSQKPVLASSSCMAEAEHSGISSGAVQMIPVSVDGTFPVQYELYCSVSDRVSQNSQNIGMLWVQYLLTEEAQQILFVENDSDLPLHRSAFRSAVNAHSSMASLKDVQLDAMTLQYRR